MSRAEAIAQLEQLDHPENLKKDLTDFWLGWTTHPDTEAHDPKELSNKLCFYKRLLAVLDTLC